VPHVTYSTDSPYLTYLTCSMVSIYLPKGWWMSEKLDGVRAYWNGSYFYSRNGNQVLQSCRTSILTLSKCQQNYVICLPYSLRYKSLILCCIVLVSILSNSSTPCRCQKFPCPDWFKKDLPAEPLDGELWCGRRLFQRCL
jgi:hypothetical protein